MLRNHTVWMLGLAGVFGWVWPVQAEFVIRAPFVSAVVGRPIVQVYAPGVSPQVPPPPLPVRPPPPIPVEPAPVLTPVPAAVRPLTLREFADTFQPVPGRYETVLLHPVTGCTVKVCFTLPPGCPRKVRVYRHELVFDYGRHEVEIRFERRGGVRVNYD